MKTTTKTAMPLLAAAVAALAFWLAFSIPLRHAREEQEVGETNRRFRSSRLAGTSPTVSTSPSSTRSNNTGSSSSAGMARRNALQDHGNPTSPGSLANKEIRPLAKLSAPRSAVMDRRSSFRNHGNPRPGRLADGQVRTATRFSAGNSSIQPSPGSAAGPYETPQPAAWVDMGDLVAPDSLRDAALQQEAERLLPILTAPPQDGAPQSDLAGQREAVAASDLWFRQRYGGWLWMQHHVQAHHMAAVAHSDAN